MDKLGLAEKLQNSDFIIESKMAKLNQNKNSEPDQQNAVWKLYLTLKINQ